MPGNNGTPAAGDNFNDRVATETERLSGKQTERAAEEQQETGEDSAAGDLFGDRLDEEMRRIDGEEPARSVATEVPLETQRALDDDEYFDDPPEDSSDEFDEEEEEEPQEQTEESAAESVGNGSYVVSEGDCMASIALEHGFFWKTLWNDPGNSELRETRGDPNVLLPGDRVHIREKRRKEVPGATEMRHRFKRRGEPSKLRLTIHDDNGARDGEPYRLEVDGDKFTGTLDENGTLEVRIPGNAKAAKLFVGEPPLEDRFDLVLGALDPASASSGVRERMINLGYESDTEGLPEDALTEYQAEHQLPETGELDDATKRSLEDEHHSD